MRKKFIEKGEAMSQDERQRHRARPGIRPVARSADQDAEFEGLHKTQERRNFLRLLAFEAAFFGLILPATAVVTLVEAIVGTLGLATYPVRGSAAFAPWRRIKQMWGLLSRHVRYVTRYAFVPKFRREVAQASASVREKIASLQLQERTRRVGEHARRVSENIAAPFAYVDKDVLLALLPQLLPGAILLPHFVVATLGLMLTWNAWTFYDVASPALAPPPQVIVEYQPQIADQQESDFGPWLTRGQVIEQVDAPSFKNLALIDSVGGIKYSAVHIGSTEGFAPRVTEKIVSPRVNEDGSVTFRDQRGSELTVNPGQVFLFEGYKSFAFAFDPDGKVLAIRLPNLTTLEMSR